MKPQELLRLVWINIIQNKFKAVMTSIGIVVGTATIVMVIAIGKGGKADVAEQFKNLNAGAVDISYDGGTGRSKSGSTSDSDGGESGMAVMPGGSAGSSGMGGASGGRGGMGGSAGGSGSAGNTGGAGGFDGGGMPGGNGQAGGGSGGDMPGGDGSFGGDNASGGRGGGDMPSFDGGGGFAGGGMFDMGGLFGGESQMNQENITLTEDDVEDILMFTSGISDATISYTTRASVDGGDLEEAATYTIAGVKPEYEQISNLELSMGNFIEESDDENKEKMCVLGAGVAEEIFGSAIDAYGSVLYIDSRMYVVDGILSAMGTVASGISPDDSIFIPYGTGVKYLVGTDVDPTITVLAEDVDNVEGVIADVTEVLAGSYPNAEFTYEDAGSKMDAAEASNQILTMLLIAMAAIVFVVGGIGIMNVLFVSVKERTNEIGILKAIGCRKRDILLEFLVEAAAISLIGGILGTALSLVAAPVVQRLGVRVELSMEAFIIAVAFAIATGTIFGFYPAYKASKLVPVEALGAE